MGNWPLIEGQRTSTGGAVSLGSSGTQISGNATNNLKGTWVEIIAATAHDAGGLLVNIRNMIQPNHDQLVDIGVGANPNEAALIPNILISQSAVSSQFPSLLWPVSVPAGTRISARMASTIGSSNNCRVEVIPIAGGWGGEALARVTDYGTAAGDSGGTSINPGGTGHTKGSWTTLVAATTAPIRQLVIAVGSQRNSGRSAATWLLDIGIGANPNETAVVPNIQLECATGPTDDGTVIPTLIGPIPVSIPVGERLSARAQCSITDATDRTVDVAVYGID